MLPLSRLAPLTARARAGASFRPPSAVRNVPVALQTNWRGISSTARKEKGPVQATKDTLKKVDQAASGVALKGIDKGERARDKLKDTVGITTQEAKAKAEDMKGEAAEYAGQGKGKAEESIGYAKGKTEQAMGESKTKATKSPSVG